MIEPKALLFFVALGVIALIHKARSSPECECEPESDALITADTKLLIEELHRLNEQHTQLSQLLFDTEQEKETTYSISYKTADGLTKTADVDSNNPHIQNATRQQISVIESRMNELCVILQEVNSVSMRRYERGTITNKRDTNDNSGECVSDEEL